MHARDEIIIYQTEDGLTKINVNMQNETVWLSKAQMAELFQRDRSVISKHIKKVFEEGELSRESNVQILHVANSDKPVEFYNLYATSVDYNPHSEESIRFFKIVQNKLHYAAHGHTAAEVIYERADAEKPFMGLTSFSGELPALKDIGIAKNYLQESELKILNNLVSGYFDLAEINAIEHKPMYMDDYVKQLDLVLSSGNRKLLVGSGSVSHKQAIDKAKAEYRKYQENTLTPVEQAYLESIKDVAKEVKKKN